MDLFTSIISKLIEILTCGGNINDGNYLPINQVNKLLFLLQFKLIKNKINYLGIYR